MGTMRLCQWFRSTSASWVCVTAVIFAAGCGTQVDEARFAAVGNGEATPATISGDHRSDGKSAAADSAATGSVLPPVDRLPVGPEAQEPAEPRSGFVGSTGAGPADGNSAGNKQSAGLPASVNTARAGSTTCDRPLSPIILGQTLATSGIIGASVGNARQGLQIWAKDVNSRGGVQCHPVQVISLDDGSDSARVASNFNTLRERGAVAILGAAQPITSGALRASAERAEVPVIGGDIVTMDWYESEYMFPQGGHPLVTYEGVTVAAARSRPENKVGGLMYCVEASICTGIRNHFPAMAARAGLTVGGSKAVSLTQSDFTAECQAFKNAKVDVVWLVLDGSANTRVARSCASLNYFPVMATSAVGIPPAAAADPALQKNTVYLGAQNVPFDTADSPGAKAFQAALKQYAPNFVPDQNTMYGWASGKLFEAAMAKVADRATAGEVTTQMVLDGLWQLKNEKLDGLALGLTFTKGSTAKVPPCYWILLLDARGVTSPFGSRMDCFKS